MNAFHCSGVSFGTYAVDFWQVYKPVGTKSYLVYIIIPVSGLHGRFSVNGTDLYKSVNSIFLADLYVTNKQNNSEIWVNEVSIS